MARRGKTQRAFVVDLASIEARLWGPHKVIGTDFAQLELFRVVAVLCARSERLLATLGFNLSFALKSQADGA